LKRYDVEEHGPSKKKFLFLHRLKSSSGKVFRRSGFVPKMRYEALLRKYFCYLD